MQQRLADLANINSMSTRWDQGIALQECRVKWAMQRKKTRRDCFKCGCVLYVRSATDQANDEKDLDEVFYLADTWHVYCFQCYHQKRYVCPVAQDILSVKAPNSFWVNCDG